MDSLVSALHLNLRTAQREKPHTCRILLSLCFSVPTGAAQTEQSMKVRNTRSVVMDRNTARVRSRLTFSNSDVHAGCPRAPRVLEQLNPNSRIVISEQPLRFCQDPLTYFRSNRNAFTHLLTSDSSMGISRSHRITTVRRGCPPSGPLRLNSHLQPLHTSPKAKDDEFTPH